MIAIAVSLAVLAAAAAALWFFLPRGARGVIGDEEPKGVLAMGNYREDGSVWFQTGAVSYTAYQDDLEQAGNTEDALWNDGRTTYDWSFSRGRGDLSEPEGILQQGLRRNHHQ